MHRYKLLTIFIFLFCVAMVVASVILTSFFSEGLRILGYILWITGSISTGISTMFLMSAFNIVLSKKKITILCLLFLICGLALLIGGIFLISNITTGLPLVFGYVMIAFGCTLITLGVLLALCLTSW